MEQVNMEDVSFVELNKKLEDMKKIKLSLAREINQNQLDAQTLRDTITAYNSKIEELKKQIAQYDSLVMKRHEEVAQLDSKNTQEMRLIEAHRSDLVTLRDSVNNEQTLWQSEKQAHLESMKDERNKLARLEISLNTRDADLKVAEKQVSGQLEDLGRRKVQVENMEIKWQAKDTQAGKTVEEADTKLRQAEKVLDDAKATQVRYESLLEETKSKQDEFTNKDAHIRTAQEEIEVKRKELSDRERDLIIEEDRLRAIKAKLRNEIKYAALTREKKDGFKAEAGIIECEPTA